MCSFDRGELGGGGRLVKRVENSDDIFKVLAMGVGVRKVIGEMGREGGDICTVLVGHLE